MLLAIDAGNTNIVFALVDGGEIRTRWRIASDPRRTADQYAVWLYQLIELEGLSKDSVDAVIIGTVVPRALHNLEVLAKKLDYGCINDVPPFNEVNPSAENIAETLSIAPGTVKIRLSRGRAELKTIVADMNLKPSDREEALRELAAWVSSRDD